MKYILYFFFCFCILACEETNICENSECQEVTRYPICFQDFVEDVLSVNPKTPRAKIDVYTYKGDTVYVKESGGEPLPDVPNAVFNSSCNFICSTGGLLGDTDPNNCDSYDGLVFIATIWQDPR